MGFRKDFMWGGAIAANQCEGGIFEGGRGLANVDVCPAGKDRNVVITGHMKMMEICIIILKKTLHCLARWDLKPIE